MDTKIRASIKHLQIDKANNMVLISIAVTTIITVFSLLSAKALLSQSAYQSKVLGQRNKAVKQLQDNISAANSLKTQYDAFEQQNPNIIGGQGGSNTGTGPSDGDNARIVLDALPSQYDFPALISSIEKIVNNDHVTVQGIGGTDAGDGTAAGGSGTTSGTTTGTTGSGTTSGTSAPGSAVPMQFNVTVTTDYATSLVLIKDFERSIRPFDITSLTLAGTSSNLTVTIQANTYYQPAVSLQITQEVIK